jgi:hypothetical protein
VEYADCHVLLVKEEAVLEGTTERLTGIGRCPGMGTKVGEKKTGVMTI